MSDFLMRLAQRGTAVPVLVQTPATFGVGSAEPTAEERRRDAIMTIATSGLFDRDYHLATYPDLDVPGIDPLEHFCDYGFREGRLPNSYFDPQWYLQHNPEAGEGGMHPLYHYIVRGDAEGRRPCLVFDPAWYRQRHGIPVGQLALAHFLANRLTGTVSPIPEFDIEFYAKHNADVIAAGVDAFEHYLGHGYREGRDPSPEFDTRWYAKRYLGGDLSTNPFFHWLMHKHEPGVYGRMPPDEATIPREVKRFTRPAPEFEEFKPLPLSAPRQAKVLAYYLPQFHAFAENDEWWGKGFTEWTNLPRGLPRFKGHYQPRVPRDLGFYRLDDVDGTATLRRQAKMARDAGLFGFVFYYYWFNGKRLMDGTLERLLQDPSVDLPFALMWANENWTRRWDGAESEVLISQDYRLEDDEAMLADFARHFRDPRYIRLQGRPLLMIYRPNLIPDAKATIVRWRLMCRERFNEDPLIFMAQAFGDTDPRAFGLDGAIEFPPHKLTQNMPPINHEIELLDPEFTGKIYTYEAVVQQSLSEAAPDFPLIKTAVPSWDNDARRQGTGLVINGSTPAQYQSWLSTLVVRARQTPTFGEALVCINAWNEWCEGTYLEPDLHFGSAYLNATARAVAGLPSGATVPYKLLLVGHDAFPSGAQQLLLNIGRVLKQHHGLQVEFLLLEGGRLESAYRALAPTTVLPAGVAAEATFKDFAARGFTRAMLNTSIAGGIAPALEAAGIRAAVMLVHELPRILHEKNLLEKTQRGFRYARHVVFPAHFVQTAVTAASGEIPHGEAHIIPQGSYKTLSSAKEEIAAFREGLGIPKGEPLVLGAGYADMRKGFDLFLQVWRLANRDRRVHFCWAGLLAPELETWIADEVAAAKATGTFHLPGLLENVAPAFGGSGAFLLTSREDPFPTVALEALSMGKPVLAFAESGGIPELLQATEAGVVVPYGDTVAMAAALTGLLGEREAPKQAEARRALVRERFAFAPYVTRLLGLALPELPRISVAVPSYNYARYMPERLGSVFRQSHPVHEVLVLDDRSKDESVAVIRQVGIDWGREINVLVNEVNSGSVFAQWRKAAELATGEWVWIAEADDTSDPEFLTRLMAATGGDPSVVIVFSDSRTIDVDGVPQWESYKGYYATVEPHALTRTEVFEGAEFVSRFMSVKNLILNVSGVVWRREALLRALDACGPALREYKMAGDWQLYLQVLSEPGVRIAYEAAPLNVHRRHAQSVTHALDVERHITEIESCHAFANASFLGLAQKRKPNQSMYINEVAKQLGLRRTVKPAVEKRTERRLRKS